MGPTKEKRQAGLPIYWRIISAPSARPRAGKNYIGGPGHTLASQYLGVSPNTDQILLASQFFGMVCIDCNPNRLLICTMSRFEAEVVHSLR
jgi:hypothetical protein